ncbi:unnamed protein product [Enterobius vermicularis]|uniref:Hypoxia up-regulated protein 1 n=1 Tax=Enterobius vermicularis TaxID=51028 RepID=A0A0N4V0I4_ENTVE|nr:unnamed protein product [Enterobius vermicularis]
MLELFLQLLNDHSAAGLSYGIFRRKEITEEAQTLLIYDMGASKTTAAILEYRYDRTLGGLEISLRLRNHLVKEFQKQKQVSQDITKNPRAMAKMFKEAERVKQVLSANVDHIAQIESVHEDQDFKVVVTRVQLEEMIKDLEPRIMKPVEDALAMAEMSIEKIDQIVLMGAATRMPKVQKLVGSLFKGKELSRFLNTDESIALGAVYQAAHLSKGFKVKKFDVRDLQIFPIQVDFLAAPKKDGTVSERIVHRPIFGYKSYMPSTKKILSFSSFTNDFSFNVNYGELKHLTQKQLSEFGSTNISSVDLIGVTKAYRDLVNGEGGAYKGIKAHFSLDGSGIVSIEGAEVCIENPPKEESAFASLAGKITGLFSSSASTEESKVEKEEKVEDETKRAEGKEAKEKKPTKDSENDERKNNVTADEAAKKHEEKKKNETEVVKEDSKPKLKKIFLEVKEERHDVNVLSDSEIQVAKKRLSEFASAEREKANREEAHNSLESLVYDVADKIEQEQMQIFITSDEKEAITKEIGRVRQWLEEEVGAGTSTDEFLKNKKIIEDLLRPIVFRIEEHNARPAMTAELLSLFNHSEIFVVLGRNLTDSGVFTEVEISTLEKVLNETKIWWNEKNATQRKLKPTDTPAYTVEDMKEKMRALDRELRYLVNKMKYSKPKNKKEEKISSQNDTSDSDENVVEVEDEGVNPDQKPELSGNQSSLSEDSIEDSKKLPSETDSNDCEGDSCGNKDKIHDATEL